MPSLHIDPHTIQRKKNGRIHIHGHIDGRTAYIREYKNNHSPHIIIAELTYDHHHIGITPRKKNPDLATESSPRELRIMQCVDPWHLFTMSTHTHAPHHQGIQRLIQAFAAINTHTPIDDVWLAVSHCIDWKGITQRIIHTPHNHQDGVHPAWNQPICMGPDNTPWTIMDLAGHYPPPLAIQTQCIDGKPRPSPIITWASCITAGLINAIQGAHRIPPLTPAPILHLTQHEQMHHHRILAQHGITLP